MRAHSPVFMALLWSFLFVLQLRAQTLPPLDLINTAQAGQRTVYLENPGGGFCGVPVELSDYNGDGFVDFAVAPIMADGGPGNARTDSGIIYIFAGDGTIGGVTDLANPTPGTPLLTIHGAQAFDYCGTEIYSADLDDDGRADLIIGATGADIGGDRTGAVYIVWGSPGLAGTIDLALPHPSVTRIVGRDVADRLGFWVEAGDVDGDGIDDLLMSADDGDGLNNAHLDRGECYVIFGGQNFPTNILLANPPANLRMLTVYGEDDRDQLGSSMHSVDLDADGFEELIVTAGVNRAIGANTGAGIAGGDGPNNSRNGAGDSYILWGRATWPAVIDLDAQRTSLLASGLLTIVYGADAGDYLGEETSSGNLDGDLYNDLVLGAITADGRNNAIANAGDAVILWGGPQLRGQVLDMRLLPSGTTTLYGERVGDIGADTLSVADVNGDGFDDLFFSEPDADPQTGSGTRNAAGEIVMLFGGPVRWPNASDVADLSASTDWPSRRIQGADAGDLLGYSMEGGDFNGDGFAEIFPNAMRGDGFNNARADAGEVTITDGRLFSRGLITLLDAPTVGTTVRFHGVADRNEVVLAAFSGGIGPAIALGGGQFLHIADDFVLALSLDPLSPFFSGLVGLTDARGVKEWSLLLPNAASLNGVRLYTAFVSVGALSGALETVSATTSFVIQP